MTLNTTLNGWKAAMADEISASGSTTSAVQPFAKFSASAAPSATLHVSNTADLLNALHSVKGGETIILNSGIYTDLSIKDLHFASNVTIKSATNLGAQFSNIKITQSDNITFDGITLNHIPHAGELSFNSAVTLAHANKITLTNSEFHGSIDTNYLNDTKLITVQDSNNFTLNNSNLHDGYMGVQVFRSDFASVTNNSFHDLRNDACDFSNVNGTLVQNNNFTNFHPYWGHTAGATNTTKDHVDAVQFWLNDTKSIFSGNVVRGNTFLQGSFTGQWHAVFIEPIAADPTGPAHYSNFLIENNVINTSNPHGIGAFRLTDSVIQHNTIVAAPGAARSPGIVLINSDNIRVENNITSKAQVDSGSTNIHNVNNIIVQYTNPNLPNYYGKIFVDGFAGPGATRGSFATSANFPTSAGADHYTGAPAHLQAAIVAATYDGTHNSLKASFDASFSANALGKIASPNAVYNWNFGDGTTATGKLVDHVFSATGAYSVSLQVTSSGETSTIAKTVVISSPVVADMHFNSSGINGLNIGLPVIDFYNAPNNYPGTPALSTGQENAAHIVGKVSIQNGVANFNDGYIDLGRDTHFFGMKELTVALDFKAGAKVTNEILLENLHVYSVTLHNNDLVFSLTTETGTQATITTTGINVRDGGWHKVAFTYDAASGTATAYLDGNAVGHASGLTGPVVTAGAHDITLGGSQYGSHFTGQIDNLQIVQAVVPPGHTLASAIVPDTIVSAAAKTSSSVADTSHTVTATDGHGSILLMSNQLSLHSNTHDQATLKLSGFTADHHIDFSTLFHHDMGMSNLFAV